MEVTLSGLQLCRVRLTRPSAMCTLVITNGGAGAELFFQHRSGEEVAALFLQHHCGSAAGSTCQLVHIEYT